ncbi:hypothetical protein [Chryseobacterium sp. POE27]|uniref:hypothetical protein n=1 Tax=Chryseobacterium sp. POE27 TaxID=3138177 RepID=UPI00321ADD96
MKKFELIFFAMLSLAASCSNNVDDNQIDTSVQTAIRPNKISWVYPSLYYPTSSDPNYYFEYDSQGRLVKRIGVALTAAPNSGVMYTYSNDYYTDVVYNGNIVILRDHSFNPSNGEIQLNERKFELNNEGQILKRYISSMYGQQYDENLTYHYDNDGKLIDILTEFPNFTYNPADPNDFISTEIERFTYVNGNLTEAKKTTQRNHVDFQTYKIVEFGNFDNVQNPFLKLGILDDYFYLSLSKNNPQSKIVKEYKYGQWFTTYTGSWNNQYDSNGNLKLFQ